MRERKQRQAPPLGSTWSKTYENSKYTMTVVRAGGAIGYQVGREVFKTPTAAAKAITKTEVNGWVFWGLDVRRTDAQKE